MDVRCGGEMMEHTQWCQNKRGHSDAAKRLSDTYNLHRIAADVTGVENIGKWFAAALADGTSDGVLYDDKRSCVQHQKHNESLYTFIRIVPHTMSVCEAEVMLSTARRLYDKGLRMADPGHRHGGQDVIKRLTVEDQLAWARGAVQNLIMPWEADR